MDWVLFGICLFFSLKGFFKGFISTVFSFFGTFFIIYISWQFSDVLIDVLKNIFNLQSFFTQIINDKIPGVFLNMEQLQNSIQNTNGFMFMLLMKIVGNINFEGSLTAGEILAPSLSNVVYKVLSFLILFLSLMIILGLVKLLLNKILSICYGNFLNKTLGFCVGLLQGLIIFGIIFFVLSILANLFLNENLLIFINSGKVSQFVYKNIIIKGIEFLF